MYDWIIDFKNGYDDRKGIKINDLISANDGDVCNSCVTYEILKNITNPFCIDIGVDCAWWSLFIISLKSTANILAFEPNIESFNKLNNLPNNIKLYNIAISDKNDLLPFKAEGGTSHSRDNLSNNYVKCEKIDKYINDKYIDLIKIDTEGHDLIIINTLVPYFKNISAIIFEYSIFWYDSDKTSAIIKSFNIFQELSNEYNYIYCLSRRGNPRLFKINNNNFMFIFNFCWDYKYQIDIICSKINIDNIPKVNFESWLNDN